MNTKEEIAKNYVPCRCDMAYISRGLYAPDCPYHSTDPEVAMEVWAKHQAIEFFKWNAQSISTYLDYLKRVNNAEGLEEMEIELNHFENNSIEGRYSLFIESQFIEQQTKE